MALSDGDHSTLDVFPNWFSPAAALCQAVRTAAQKRLNDRVSTLGTTYARTALGLPVLAVYLLAGLLWVDPRVPDFSPAFLFAASCGAAVQVASTSLLIVLIGCCRRATTVSSRCQPVQWWPRRALRERPIWRLPVPAGGLAGAQVTLCGQSASGRRSCVNAPGKIHDLLE